MAFRGPRFSPWGRCMCLVFVNPNLWVGVNGLVGLKPYGDVSRNKCDDYHSKTHTHKQKLRARMEGAQTT